MAVESLSDIPPDWQTACLATLVLDGPKNGYSGRTGENLLGTLTLRLSATSSGNLVLNEDTTKRLNETIHPSSDLFLRAGDVLIQRSNTLDLVGTTVVFDGPSGVYVYPDLLIRLRCRDEATAHWFWRYANSQRGRQYFVSVAAGSTGSMPKLSAQRLRAMPIPLPPPAERRAVTAALSDVDGLIGALEKLIAKKRAIKQAAMQQLLTGKTRLPGFSAKWGTKRLGDLGHWRGGSTPSMANHTYWTGGTIPWLSSGDVRQGWINDSSGYITQQAVSETSVPLIPPNSIIVVIRSGILRRFLPVACSTRVVAINQDLRALEPGPSHDPEFLHQAIIGHERRLLMDCLKAGTTVESIDSAWFRSFEISMPDRDEQCAIATVLSDMDAEIEALDRRREKTKQIKQGMMQQLLTGRIRLVEPQALVGQPEEATVKPKSRNRAFNDAVVISVLAKHFGSEKYPLGRMRYQKLSYLLHRHAEGPVEGYLKKAAGPYNPNTRYGGSEKIALENGYIREQQSGEYHGFVAADNIVEAEAYFDKRYGSQCVRWLEQFRRKRNDDLELLATVDMAAEELRAAGRSVDVAGVKEVLRGSADWKPKLDRPVFSDVKIAKAIETCRKLFH